MCWIYSKLPRSPHGADWDFAAVTGRPLAVSPLLSEYVLGLARNTISVEARGVNFAEETRVAESLDRLIAFTGRRGREQAAMD